MSTPAASPEPAVTPSSSERFLGLSVELTGYDRVELEGTGAGPVYQRWLAERFPAALTDLMAAWQRVAGEFPPGEREVGVRRLILADPRLGPFAQSITLLWYTATWYPPAEDWSGVYGGQPPGSAPEAIGAAYTEALVWKTARAHPMAAKPTGFGTWSLPPEGA